MKISNSAQQVAKELFKLQGFISTPETPIANAFRERKINQAAELVQTAIDTETNELIKKIVSLEKTIDRYAEILSEQEQ